MLRAALLPTLGQKELGEPWRLQDKPTPTSARWHQPGWQGRQQMPQKSAWLLIAFLRSDLFHHHLGDSETLSPIHLSQESFLNRVGSSSNTFCQGQKNKWEAHRSDPHLMLANNCMCCWWFANISPLKRCWGMLSAQYFGGSQVIQR